MRLYLAVFALLVPSSLAQEFSDPCRPNPCGINTECSVSSSEAAVCRCRDGWDHEPGSNTIEGCPVRRRSSPEPPRVSRPRVSHDRNRGSNTNRFSTDRFRDTSNRFRDNLGDPCADDPCGRNTECRTVRNRAVCSCLPNHRGDPYSFCEPDPCDRNPCGIDAECIDRGSTFDCRCPSGFSGDPFVRCLDDPCNQHPSPCAQNAICDTRNDRAICTCRPGYDGDGYSRCTLKPCLTNPCGINADCIERGDTHTCQCQPGYDGDAYSRCTLNPCQDNPCGPNAECSAQGNSARCTCLEGYVGDATSPTGCELEPCSTTRSACGRNADCAARGRSAICSCPRGFSGDPYSSCEPDPCGEDPCGTNAICESSGGRDGRGYTCTCPPGYVGSPYSVCTFDPCADNPCGPNTECTVSGDSAVCRCQTGFVGSPNSRSGCRADPCSVARSCGRNAECRNEADTRSGASGGMRPVCYCLSRHVGDPYDECHAGDCVSNSDCSNNQACQDFRCTDPCLNGCGPGADCEVQDHVAICKCPRGFTGDPFKNCRKFTRSEICAACGANTECEVGPDDTPICKCARNYIGNPLTGCRYECERDHECSSSQKCSEFRCVAVCDQNACGEMANCVARNNRADCSCPQDFLGDPYTRCYTECTRHAECSENQACVKFKCVDPCYEPRTVCGTGADCNVRNHKAICSCPKGYTGDPFDNCRQFTRDDLCARNPCGINADCQPGFDRSGGDRPVCTCPPGYRGDPLVECRRGDCDNDNDCPDNRGCYDFRCEDPCSRDSCGAFADCRVRNHAAVCTCPSGRVGDPFVSCRDTRGGQTRFTGVNTRRFNNF